MNVEFDSKDESFRWVMEWLADNSYAQKHSGVYICTVGKDTKEPQLTPGEGMHWLNAGLRASGCLYDVFRVVEVVGGGSSSVSGRNETLSVTMLGWTRGNIDAFIEECRRQCNEKIARALFYTAAESTVRGTWRSPSCDVPYRQSFLDNHLAEDLQHDAQEFLFVGNLVRRARNSVATRIFAFRTSGHRQEQLCSSVGGRFGSQYLFRVSWAPLE